MNNISLLPGAIHNCFHLTLMYKVLAVKHAPHSKKAWQSGHTKPGNTAWSPLVLCNNHKITVVMNIIVIVIMNIQHCDRCQCSDRTINDEKLEGLKLANLANCAVFAKLYLPIAQISLYSIHTYLQFWMNSPNFLPPNRFIGRFAIL